jgi:predicted nucleotidyltransferase
MNTPILVLLEVAAALEKAGVEYVVVGSLASSMHGMYRATADIDLVVDLKPIQIESLLQQVQESFYVDESVMKRAVDRKHSFNLIHFDSVFKVDFFIPKPGDFAWQQLLHRQLRPLGQSGEETVYVSTAEDIVIAKLIWYRSGNEVSDVQWRDIMGILGSRSSSIDLEYLRVWAEKFDVSDLLERALIESQNPSQ